MQTQNLHRTSSTPSILPSSIEVVCSTIGIDQSFAVAYKALSVKQLFPWQMDCMFNTEVMKGRNLVYSVPTGSGKTLVAELAILKTCTLKHKIALITVPFVSMVLEKETFFQKLVTSYNKTQPSKNKLKIQAFYGENGATKNLRSILKCRIIVCTYEKALLIVNALISAGLSDAVNLCVVDEFHNLGSQFNGSVLEGLICKLRFSTQNKTQFICLSATIRNVRVLANWLQAELFVSDYRPIPLKQYAVSRGVIVKIGSELQDTADKDERRHITSDSAAVTWTEGKYEDESVFALSKQAIHSNKQILIFCSTKMACMQTCAFLASRMPTPQANDLHRRQNLIAQLKCLEEGSVNTLPPYDTALLCGVAFHHAGLNSAERCMLEDAYKSGILNILTCTSTLAAGVNLPAHVVVIRGMRVGKEQLSTGQYLQMVGRAGRPGYGNSAESYLIIRRNELSAAVQMAKAPLPDVCSALTGKPLVHLIMDTFALGIVCDIPSSLAFIKSTFLFYQDVSTDSTALVLNQSKICIRYLLKVGALAPTTLRSQDNSKASADDLILKSLDLSVVNIHPTRFGRSIVQGGFFIDDAVSMYAELVRSQEVLHLDSLLHCLFLVTPLTMTSTIDWAYLFNVCTSNIDAQRDPDSEALAIILKLHGVSEASLLNWHKCNPSRELLQKCANGQSNFSQFVLSSNEKRSDRKDDRSPSTEQLHTCLRLWNAWILLHFSKGLSIDALCQKFGLNKVDLTTLADHARHKARKIQRFCKEMVWKSLEHFFSEVHSIILEFESGNPNLEVLLSLSNCIEMTPIIAKCLWASGIQSLEALAVKSVREVAHILQLSNQFVFTDTDLSVSNIRDTIGEKPLNSTVQSSRELVRAPIRDQYEHLALLSYASRLQQAAKLMIETKDMNAAMVLSEIPAPFLPAGDPLNQECESENDTDSSEEDSEGQEGMFADDRHDKRNTSLSSVTNSRRHESDQSMKRGFAMRHLRGFQHWQSFLERLSCAREFSMQVLFRRLPGQILDESKGCTCLSKSAFLDATPLDSSGSSREAACHLCGKVAGAGICFGGSECFFLPLPTPLPAIHLHEQFQPAKVSSACIRLPQHCRELICSFVGEFETFLGAPPTSLHVNSCLTLNRQWAAAARSALRAYWEYTGSVPWQCLDYLLTSPHLTLVGKDLKRQLDALQQCGIRKPCCSVADLNSFLQKNDDPSHNVHLPIITNNSQRASLQLKHASRCTCYTAIAVLRLAKQLQPNIFKPVDV